MPQCRICHAPINKKTEIEGVDWFMPTRNYYYHIKCYKRWKEGDPATTTDEDWQLLIYDFLSRDIKVSYNYFLCEAQRHKFNNDLQINNKGIYFALKYFYGVQRHNWEGNGGIGIVPYIFDEAKQYWTQQEFKQRGFMAALEKQIREEANISQVVKIKPKAAPRKEKYNLDEI